MRQHTTVPAFRAGAVVSVRGVPRGVRLAVVLLAVSACSTNGPSDGTPGDRAEAAVTNEGAVVDSVSIEDALAKHTAAWMEIDGVEGTGIGRCHDVPCIKIFVSRSPESFEDVLPDSVHGHPVRLEPTGRFEAQ